MIPTPPHPPFSWAGLGPQGGARILSSRQRARRLEVTRNAARDIKLGAVASSLWVGVRLSPVSSVPLQRRSPHLHTRVRAETLTVGKQRREAEQGGAAAA